MDKRRVVYCNDDDTCSVAAGFYHRDDKGVLINRPIEEIIISGSTKFQELKKADETFKECYDRIGEETLQNLHPFTVTTIDEIPSDRTYRNAWSVESGTVYVNMEKARLIHMDRLRKMRDGKLKELDIETLKGKDVQAEKQVLRDIPQTLDLSTITTIEQLKATIPAELE